MMKNSTLLLASLSLMICVFSAKASEPQRGQVIRDHGDVTMFRSNPVPSLIHAVPFYMEDFDGGIPSGWQRTDNTSSGVNWRWTSTGIYNVGSYPGLDTLNSSGTSAANGYMIFDSDSSGGSAGPEDADLTSDVIDCSMYQVIRLRFNQLLYHFDESAKVYVSNDGTNWVEVYDASSSLAQGQATPNADVVDIDISAYAGAQATVQVRFTYIGNYDYWWMIDDVELYEPAAADAGVYAITSPATSCTILSSAETVSVEVFNFGSDSISGFDVSYVINGGAAVTETITDTIAPGMSHSHTFTATADLSVPGNYMIMAYTSLAGDADNSNDTNSINIANGALQIGSSSPYTMGFESGEDFDRWSVEDGNFDGHSWVLINTLARTGSMCARMATPTAGSVADDWLFTPCLDLSDTVSYDLEFWYRTTSTSTDANLEVMIGSLPAAFGMTQSIQSAFDVSNTTYQKSSNNFSVPSAGVYYIGFHVTNADSATALRIDDINLSISTGVGIKSVSKKLFSVYPNPATGIFMIRGGSDAGSAEVSISNMLGQVVFQKSYENLTNESIDLSQEAEGQYIIRILSEKSVNSEFITLIR